MLIRTITALLLTLSFLAPHTISAAEIKMNDLPDVDYTKGSLANPHTVRIGEVQAFGGRVAVLERVYDVSAPSRSKQWELQYAKALFKKYGDDVPEAGLVSLMTAERTLLALRKFKQHIRVWDAQKPRQSYTIAVTPVFSADEAEVVSPVWTLEDRRIVLMQPNADRSDAEYFAADFKTKKFKKVADQMVNFSELDGTRVEGTENIQHATIHDGEFITGEFSIRAREGSEATVVQYPMNEYDEDVTEAELHPLVMTLGFAGVFVKGYTRGMFVAQMGVTPTTNIMNNEMPEEVTFDAVKKLIDEKWKNPESFEFATYQVTGYRLHK